MENRLQTKIVHTELGDIRGFIQQGIIKFTAIPYCQPPIGKARFRPVQAPMPWDGVLDATRQSPMCPQGPSDLEKAMGALDYPIAEDSLTLTISTPSTEGKHPVAVLFHGGANMSGAGNIAWYDGENLARQGNAVVVGVNFRIGALGFLYHPLLNIANLSILDQIEALRWIQKNIQAFGGDPNNVTVFGQSAGANAIVHMMALKETEGLFHKVILQSPSLGRGSHTTIDAMRIAECHFKHLGLDRNDSNLAAKIREKSIHAILKATEAAYSEMGAEFGGMLFKPVSDEWARPEAAIEAAANEASRRQLRILIGTTADELQAFIQPKNEADVKAMRRLQYERYDEPDNQFALLAAQGGCPRLEISIHLESPRIHIWLLPHPGTPLCLRNIGCLGASSDVKRSDA